MERGTCTSTAFARFPGSVFKERLSEIYAWGLRSAVDILCGVGIIESRNSVLFLTELLSQPTRTCSTELNGEISTMTRDVYKQL